MSIKRGDIWYVDRSFKEEGSEQRDGRPAIVVSNNKCNEYSAVVEVVYLTTQPKRDLPTHVDIRSAPMKSIALCEQINSVSTNRLTEKIGECTEFEMAMVDAGLEISLALNPSSNKNCEDCELKQSPDATPDKNWDNIELNELRMQLVQVSAERAVFRNLYENLLERMTAR